MYSYTWDIETGGILLNSAPLQFSKEPRPVYSQELRILGLDKYWSFEDNNDAPYMWAEANNYFYRGRLVAQARGGAPFIAPQMIVIEDPEPSGTPLKPIDIESMVRKNHGLMEQLSQDTIKKIYNTYKEYKSKVDLFYVAFSGGKDSVLALDLVQRAIPHSDFKVLFGDTQMEFPDTYKTIDKVKEYCKGTGIDFLTAKSELTPEYTWTKFGPPAQRMRWCCSVHKTTPQILLLRKYLKNSHFRGMAFTGIRAEESVSRAAYDDISLGEKIRGQYSCHPILEWNSAELFLYTYENNLIINDAYRKGNSRAGCLVCPLAGYKNMWFKEQCYSKNADGLPTTTIFNEIILKTTSKEFSTEAAEHEFMNIAGWKARRSGRELNISKDYIEEEQSDTLLKMILSNVSTSWKEWLKTVGQYTFTSDNSIELVWDNAVYKIDLLQQNGTIAFSLHVGNSKTEIALKKAFKIALKKSAYCIGCQVCEANCPSGFITMSNGEVKIDDKCIKCRKCHDIDNGCLVANSNRLPKKDNKMGSINRYGNMGIEFDWVKQYFKLKNNFWESDHSLGSKMVKNLESFLADSEINIKKSFSQFGEVIDRMDLDSADTWGLILCNLAYSSEFNWWIKNIDFGTTYTVDALKELLEEETENNRTHIVSAFKNILISNKALSEGIGLGVCDYYIKGGKRYLNSIQRLPWRNPEPRVILYALYKFAEACDNYMQFPLSRISDTMTDGNGITPAQLFGLDNESLRTLLQGLATNYPEFINVAFTLDLDNINLKEGKTSKDVLTLF